MTIDYEKIKRLVQMVEDNRLRELVVEEDDQKVTIKASRTPKPAAQSPIAQAHTLIEFMPCDSTVAVEVSEISQPAIPPSENLLEIRSPMIGVFYRRPSPDSPTFAEVGDVIEEGQTIGLIEAMKVFSEVPAEAAGRVVALPAESGKLVQQDDVLAVIDTSPAAD